MQACQQSDPACDGGGGLMMGAQVPAPIPTMSITLPVAPLGQALFLRFSAPQYIPYDYYIEGPITGDVPLTQPIPLVSNSSYSDFVGGLGLDPVAASTLGTLGVQIFDCDQDPAPDVSLFLPDAESIPALQQGVLAYYVTGPGQVPVPTSQTDNSGIAGFFKLPLINITVEAVWQGHHFGRTTIPIKEGRITTASIRAVGYANGY
jgi:hypothetical protein